MTAAHTRLARLLNMGAYGDNLAAEILEDHLKETIYDAHVADLKASGWVEVAEDWKDGDPLPSPDWTGYEVLRVDGDTPFTVRAEPAPNDCPDCRCDKG